MSAEFERIFSEANDAGIAAGAAVTAAAVIPAASDHPLYEKCGFVWIHLPKNTAFAFWLEREGLMIPTQPKGCNIICREFGHDILRKKAYCAAFVSVLASYDLESYVDSAPDW